MKARSVVVTAAAWAVLLAAGPAVADDLAGRFSIGVQVGTQSDLGGNKLQSGQGPMLGKPTTVSAKRYKDLYKPDVRYQAFVGYGLTAKLELLARGSYYKNEATGVSAGSYDGQPLYAFFDQLENPQTHAIEILAYEEYGGELALRYYFAPQSRLKSFVAPVVGLRHVSETHVSFTAPDAASRLMNVPFTQSGNAMLFGLDIGFAFDVTDNFFVGVDTGVRYQAAPKAANAPQLSGISSIDESDARWTAPVVAQIGVRF